MMNEKLSSLSFIIFFEHRHFPINDAREICAVVHDPSDAVAALREFGPLARLLRVLFDEHCIIWQFDVAQT